jgi:hypothetical protein
VSYVINPYLFPEPVKLWVPTKPLTETFFGITVVEPVNLSEFRPTAIGGNTASVEVTWGDGTSQTLVGNEAVNKTFTSPTSGIQVRSLTPITQIFCGTSSPTLGGVVDLSGLPDLINFTCASNGITELRGYTNNPNLRSLVFTQNSVTGSIPNLSGNTSLEIYRCFGNQLTGFGGGDVSNSLGSFQAQNNRLTSSAVNAILAAFVAAGRTTGTRQLFLHFGTNGAPTGQGLTDRQILLNRGWDVRTN